MDFHSAIPVSQLLSSTLSALNNVRDLAKESSNHELKEKISETYDAVLSLKERMLAMTDEIRDLKAQLAVKASFTGPVPPFGYVFKDGDMDHPLCPNCYQEKGHESFLPIAEPWNDGTKRRKCNTCGWIRLEESGEPHPPRMAVSRSRYTR
jgi:hypothetical protein